LLAAIEGLKKLLEHNEPFYHKKSVRIVRRIRYRHLYVVTDSEYVVKGITQCFPSWHVCLRFSFVSVRKRPANLDLFMKLDECAHNRKADSLAKRAAKQRFDGLVFLLPSDKMAVAQFFIL
jgi:ribonuclease HI